MCRAIAAKRGVTIADKPALPAALEVWVLGGENGYKTELSSSSFHIWF